MGAGVADRLALGPRGRERSSRLLPQSPNSYSD